MSRPGNAHRVTHGCEVQWSHPQQEPSPGATHIAIDMTDGVTATYATFFVCHRCFYYALRLNASGKSDYVLAAIIDQGTRRA